MEVRASWRRSAQNEFQLLPSKNHMFCERRTAQIWQVLRVFQAIQTYMIKGEQIKELFIHDFCERNFCFTPLNGAQLLQFVFNSSQIKTKMTYEMSVQTAFKV